MAIGDAPRLDAPAPAATGAAPRLQDRAGLSYSRRGAAVREMFVQEVSASEVNVVTDELHGHSLSVSSISAFNIGVSRPATPGGRTAKA